MKKRLYVKTEALIVDMFKIWGGVEVGPLF